MCTPYINSLELNINMLKRVNLLFDLTNLFVCSSRAVCHRTSHIDSSRNPISLKAPFSYGNLINPHRIDQLCCVNKRKEGRSMLSVPRGTIQALFDGVSD